MVIQSVKSNIPPEIAAGIESGDLVRIGGVVRKRLGKQLVMFLDEVPDLSDGKEVVRGAAASVKHLKGRVNLHDPRVLAGAIIAGAVAAGGVTYLATRTQRRPAKPKASELVQKCNTSLAAYLEAVRDGSLHVGILDRLISDLDALKECAGEGWVALESSTEQAEQLVALVAGYTTELARADCVPIVELQGPAPHCDDSVIIALCRHLEAQRRIFREAV